MAPCLGERSIQHAKHACDGHTVVPCICQTPLAAKPVGSANSPMRPARSAPAPNGPGLGTKGAKRKQRARARQGHGRVPLTRFQSLGSQLHLCQYDMLLTSRLMNAAFEGAIGRASTIRAWCSVSMGHRTAGRPRCRGVPSAAALDPGDQVVAAIANAASANRNIMRATARDAEVLQRSRREPKNMRSLCWKKESSRVARQRPARRLVRSIGRLQRSGGHILRGCSSCSV